MRIVDDCCSGVMSLSLVEPNVLVRGRLKLRVILPYVLIVRVCRMEDSQFDFVGLY